MPGEATPNADQRELIETTDGIVRVDAGAGTGKTFAVTRRYANILDSTDARPADILLVTFTNNAATEMRDRIVRQADAEPRDLKDAPIGTFHSLCHDLLMEYGHCAPQFLGIDHAVTQATSVLEDETIERDRFRTFYRGFRDDHSEFEAFYRAVSEPTNLLDLIKELAAKGVFPTADGWYRDGAEQLRGDREAFEELFQERNRLRNGGSRQSALRSDLGRYGETKTYRKEAPTKESIRGPRGTKSVDADLADRVFEQDRDALFVFVRDLYHAYLSFCVRRNELNFGFLQGLAYILLCEDHAIRDEVAFEYVMVDEFQDSSEIQFKLALLLSERENLCVVGDWKQSIYSFQYADVRNITEFKERLQQYTDALNRDHDRVELSPEPVQDIELTRNYRSTQALLDFAEGSLTVPASKSEEVDVEALEDEIVSLEADSNREHSRIEAFQHPEEAEAILTEIQRIVGNEDYRVEGQDGELREPTLGDITALTRTRDFGRELLETAEANDVPLAYEGDEELLRSDQAKLLLAWLRILDGDGEAGWAVVLERAGFTLDEIKAILDAEQLDQTPPEGMLAFRELLEELESVGGIAEQVFQRYGYDGAVADELLHTIQSLYDATTMSRGDLVAYIERGIEEGVTHPVSTSRGDESVLVQTIHATKGLEHPIVILANMNRYRFPPSSGGSSAAIRYEDPIGLRQRSVYAEDHGQPFVYDDWKSDVLGTVMPTEYDEERRLLYVAMTRAEHHLLFAAGERPNQFLRELPVDIESLEPDIGASSSHRMEQAHLQIAVPEASGPRRETPHTLMDERVFEAERDGRGRDVGTLVHEYAEAYAAGASPEKPAIDGRDIEHVSAFIDALDGECRVEESLTLPLTVDGERVAIKGTADLIHVSNDAVQIIDYKTHVGPRAREEYRVQLSIYAHVLESVFPDRSLEAILFHTATGASDRIELLETGAIEDRVRSGR